VRHADVILAFDMLDMEMPRQEQHLVESAPGVYTASAPALVMVGHWGLSLEIAPPGRTPFSVFVVDHAIG
jgi:copper transport protein